jgi:aryl-alcohol dehydrogenase
MRSFPAQFALTASVGAGFKLLPGRLTGLQSDEILVRIVAAGICHTDLVIAEGGLPVPFPIVLGHEGAGIVELVGSDVSAIEVGDHVALTFLSCGQCVSCAAHAPAYCHQFAGLNGSGARRDGSTTIEINGAKIGGNFFGQSSFATRAIAHERNAVKIPKALPFHIAAPLGCGVQTGAGAILKSLNCAPASSVLIAGAGSVGLSALLAARVRRCEPIIVVEPNADRRALALQLGATLAVSSLEAEDLSSIWALCPAGVDHGLDTSGRSAVIAKMMELTAPRGSIGVLGLGPAGEDEIAVSIAQLRGGGRTLRGIVEGDSDPAAFIPELAKMQMSGAFPYDAMITTYPFERIDDAIRDHIDGRAIKPVLVMPSDEAL